MKAIRRVVVATDFSPGSNAAVARATLLAQAHGATLDLLHAFDVGAWHALERVFDVRRLRGEVPADVQLRERLTALAEELGAESGLEVVTHFGIGEAAAAIESHVRSTHAAVLVIARRSEPDTPGIGSTLLRVLRITPCPVLVVGSGGVRGYERVLSAVDLREVSLRAAALAVQMFPAAEHRLLSVVDPAWEREIWRRSVAQDPAFAAQESLHDQAMRQLDALALELRQHPGCKVQAEVVDAVPVRAIVERAGAWGADCVVVGRHSQGLLADRLLGSTALDLIHHTSRDVLVVS